jgi:hypothetical protein
MLPRTGEHLPRDSLNKGTGHMATLAGKERWETVVDALPGVAGRAAACQVMATPEEGKTASEEAFGCAVEVAP